MKCVVTYLCHGFSASVRMVRMVILLFCEYPADDHLSMSCCKRHSNLYITITAYFSAAMHSKIPIVHQCRHPNRCLPAGHPCSSPRHEVMKQPEDVLHWENYENDMNMFRRFVWTCWYCNYLDCDEKLIEDVLGYIDQDVWAKQVTPKALYPCLWKHQEADEYDSNLIQFSSIILWFIYIGFNNKKGKQASLQFFIRPEISNQLFQHVFSS